MEGYNGTIDVIAGFRQKNGGNFALCAADQVQVDPAGKRLDQKLLELEQEAGGDPEAITEEEINGLF